MRVVAVVPLVLLYLDHVFHFCFVFDSLYLWIVNLGVVNDVVDYLVVLVLQL